MNALDLWNASIFVVHDLAVGFGRPSRRGGLFGKALRQGARVADVARKYGLRSQQLTHWRRAARWGRFALEDVAAHRKTEPKIEIIVGKVLLRLERDAASTRIAEIVAALERSA